MKSLASITEKDIEIIKMALNDSLSDMNTELKGNLSENKQREILGFKSKYTRVLDKLRQNPSIYALSEYELDIAAGGLNDAIELLEEHLTDELDEEERSDIIIYRDDCLRLIDVLAV